MTAKTPEELEAFNEGKWIGKLETRVDNNERDIDKLAQRQREDVIKLHEKIDDKPTGAGKRAVAISATSGAALIKLLELLFEFINK